MYVWEKFAFANDESMKPKITTKNHFKKTYKHTDFYQKGTEQRTKGTLNTTHPEHKQGTRGQGGCECVVEWRSRGSGF